MQQIAIIEALDNRETDKNICEENDIAYIFDSYYKRVFNYIYYRVNKQEITEDLTSEVFEKIILKISTFSDKKSPFEVWVFAIARNVVNDYFRNLKKYRLFSLEVVKDFVSKEKTPEEFIIREETNEGLFQALKILSTKERNIVALKFGANLKNKEIAVMLDITESNVGVILYRTMKKLRKEIERRGENE
ncbi:sigma-70 family RNA polymerase sigma factor [Clostridium sediminicola]|uniref:sigma-70 family RNA polymerase sigma factor n=1 Tax=Clostridium sediminicola TaxID=3114879 RepID=UPI0031F2103D